MIHALFDSFVYIHMVQQSVLSAPCYLVPVLVSVHIISGSQSPPLSLSSSSRYVPGARVKYLGSTSNSHLIDLARIAHTSS